MLRFIYLIIFLLPLYLVKIRIGFVPFNVLELMIWFIFGIWLVKGKLRGIREIGEIGEIRGIILPSLLILIGAVLSALFSSDINVSAGILKGWFLAPMVFALMAYAEAKDEKSVKRLLGALFFSAAAVALIALFYRLSGKLTFDGRLSAFFLSPNHLAMYLAPGFIIGVWFLILRCQVPFIKSFPPSLFQREEIPSLTKRGWGRFKKATILFGLILIGLALYLTYSYAAWISILAAAVTFFVGTLVLSPDRAPRQAGRVEWLERNFTLRRAQGIKFRSLIVFFIILIVVLFLSQFGGEKMNNLLNSERSSWQSRIMIWKTAWEILKDYPIFGIGPGMFQEYYLAYQSRFAIPYLEWAVPQPHNIFLAFWLQTGILGLLGFLWLVVVFFKRILKQAGVTFSCCGTPRPTASSNSPHCENATPACFDEKNQLALVLAGLMVYILLHGLVDTTYFKNDLAVIFWLIIALSFSVFKLSEISPNPS